MYIVIIKKINFNLFFITLLSNIFLNFMKLKKLKKKTINFLYDHPIVNEVLKNSYMIIITVISAIIFSFGFKCFISPNYSVFYDVANNEVAIRTLASTGASGMSQVFVEIIKLCGIEWVIDGEHQYILNFIFYLVVNIPLCIFGWFKVGKKFTIYTILNVSLVSLFGILIPTGNENDFVNQIAKAVFNDPVSRILFAGTCTGLSCGLAYSINTSAGGVDIIAFYLSEKKSTPAGKFSAFMNAVIISVFSILSVIPAGVVGKPGSGSQIEAVEVPTALIIVLYTLLYMIVTTIVIDTLDTKNKKVSLQIITKNANLSQIIIANIPHGCTVVPAEGGYTGEKQYMIYISIRKYESKKVINLCRRVDPNCFINAISTEQVYGKFYRQPVE